jgi:putative transcriptional regulator
MHPELDLFDIRPEDKIAERGKILISEPFLPDLFFNRSIIYLTDHNLEGSVGFILNMELDLKISDTLEGFDECDASLYMGGPVALDTLHYLHSLGNMIPNSVEINNNIFWGGDIDAIKYAIKTGKVKPNQIKFFLGYSGWTTGQLERELKENSWVIASAKHDLVMNNHGDDAWKHALRGMNRKYRAWADFPESPEMN